MSGNPNGRPRTALREIREKLFPHADKCVKALLGCVEDGNMDAIKTALAYLYGKPADVGPFELTREELLAAVNEHVASGN